MADRVLALLLLVPVLGACDRRPPSGAELKVPRCAPGWGLGTDRSGQLICKTLPRGTLVAAPCQAGEGLTSNGWGVSCVPLATSGQDQPALQARLTDLMTRITSLEAQITALEARPPGRRAYVGNTTTTTFGRINFTGTDFGLSSAAALCNAQFGPGASMCTVLDIYDSVASGRITSAMAPVAKAWIYFPAWKVPMPGAQEPNAGLADNCAGYTYPTADLRWFGTAVSTGMLTSGRWGVRLHGGSEAGCNMQLPIACCK